MKWSEITSRVEDILRKRNLSVLCIKHIDSMNCVAVRYCLNDPKSLDEASFPYHFSHKKDKIEESLDLFEKEIVCRNLRRIFDDLPESYEGLCKELFVLKPLKSSMDYGYMVQIAGKFMTYRGDFTKDQERYLSELADILNDYEKHVTE